ncbi:MAG: polyphenol oxidase family protein [Candidatus Omnitrophica bacterium]|nr:polyphenol oxidase family protein [Candidatus Omnitrophota bacterium]
MKIEETDNCYIVRGFFSDDVIAGYTKPGFSFKLPQAVGYIQKDLDADISSFAFMEQVHGRNVEVISKGGLYTCDGVVTDTVGLMLCVKTADCMPILCHDVSTGRVGAIHMGWRSAVAGIINNIPVDFEKSKFFLGVGLRKCCYAVGANFKDNKEFNGCITELPGNSYFDVIGFAYDALLRKNILSKKNIFDLNKCSLHDDKKFPSYRRDKTEIRTISFILKIK